MAKRDTPGVIAPPPLIYLGFLFLGWGLSRAIGETGFGLPVDVRRILALVPIVAGLVIDGAAAGHFRRLGTAVEPWKPSSALATGGLYRFSRNPIYLGFAITYAGLAVAMNSPITLALLVPCLLVIDRFVIAREERYQQTKFGESYSAYRRSVRRWL
jgi:protein-S-isoprenylcysteine O-methyltransferase Ste14